MGKDYLKNISFGLLGEGKRVTDSRSETLSALVLRQRPEEEVKQLFAYGADEVVLLDSLSMKSFYSLPALKILTKLILESQVSLVLFAASHLGNEMAGWLSVTCQAGLVTNATRIEQENGYIVVIKNTHGDKVENRIRILTELQLVTLRPKELQAIEPDFGRQGNMTQHQIAWDDDGSAVEVVEFKRGDHKNIDLGYADLIVAGGKGVGGGEAFERICNLADIVGAIVGGSREAVYRCWIPFEQQIGQTGKTVSPRCLIAFGLSGAIQFAKGIEDVQHIIAINTDKRAPIFCLADLKILGDLHEIVPALIKHIEQHRSSKMEKYPT